MILIIFWNICNDIFDTRQAKRIFPLITAGGILGRVLGSFSTDFLTRTTNIDNLLLISAGLLLLAAVASRWVGRLFPPPMATPKTHAPEKKGWSSPIAGIKEMSLLAKGSLLFMLLAAIRVLPNIIGPLFDYQYSVITTTLHNPANNIMINLFPDEFRAKIRPFLQMVSRAGSLLGSLILLGLNAFIHTSYFSIFGLLFAAPWILVTLRLKRNYSSFLLESLLDKQVDLRELAEVDLTVLVQDKETLNRLLVGLREEKGEAATLCARILSEARYPELGEAILSVIGEKEPHVQVDLFDLLRPEEARPLVPRLVEMAETAPPWLLAHLVRSVGRLTPNENIDFLTRTCEVEEKAVQAEAIVGLYHAGMGDKGYSLLSEGLERRDPEDLAVAVTTVARAGEVKLGDRLYAILERETDPRVQARTLEALGILEMPQRNERIMPWLDNPSSEVRAAAVSALDLDVEEAVKRAIQMLGDESADVREAALERIDQIGKEAVPALLEALISPKRALKDGILRLLESLEVKDLEFSEFITGEIRQAYESIRTMESLKTLEETPALGLLIRHLEDKNDDAVFTVFRILEAEGEGSKMRTIYKGLKAVASEKANALETLENTLHPALSQVLIPLVEDIPVEEKLKVSQKEFGIDRERASDPLAVVAGLLESEDPMTKICALFAIGEGRMEGLGEKLETLEGHPDRAVQETARQALERTRGIDREGTGKPVLSTMDKVIHLEKISIFSDLQVRELAAIGSVTGERDYSKDEIVVSEGESGDTMFLIISGEVCVIQNQGTDQETLVATLIEGNYFGEMALFEGKPRANTVRTDTDTKLLVLGKREFEGIMAEFPQIPINICRVFSQRMRDSGEKVLN